MKLSVFLAATLVAFASIASAAPLCTSLNVVTLADYVALGSTGCQIGDKVFFNFFDSPTSGGSATAPVPASAVSVTPVGVGTYNPGLTFSSSDWSVTGGSTTANSFLDMSFGFTVSVLPGGNSIDDASVTMGTPVTTGTGVVTLGETILAANGFTVLGTLNVASNGARAGETFFAPTGTIQVKKDFFLGVPQNGTGTASISTFTENFSEIPEPVGAILIGSGLLALGAWRRRGNRG